MGKAFAAWCVAGLLGTLGCGRPSASPQAVANAPPLPGLVETAAEDVASPPGFARFSRFEYHFDRNALLASRAVGASILAITVSGHLLRFDRKSLALTGEHLSSRAASALGPATLRSVLVGYKSGLIAELDPATFEQKTVASVPGVVAFIGETPKCGLVVVFGRSGPRALRERLSVFRVRCTKTGRDIPIRSASTYLLDSAGRLWLGQDHGEWGGALFRVDLERGNVVELTDQEAGIYGLHELKPGEVWAHGGTLHMGLFASFVKRVAPEPAKDLFRFQGGAPFDEAGRELWFNAQTPRAPITHVARLPSGKLWVLSYGDVLETDPSLKSFRRVTKLTLRYVSGRPDAVGSYPAVQQVEVEPTRVVLTTLLDGLVTIERDKAVPHTQTNQLSERAFYLAATENELVVPGYGEGAVHGAKGWSRVRLVDPQDEDASRAALNAEERRIDEILQRWRQAQLETPLRIHGNPEIHAAIAWDRSRLIVATDEGLCFLPKDGSDICTPFKPPGVDNFVRHFARDGQGRLWLAGSGLWFIDRSGRAVAIHPPPPFLYDTEVYSMSVVGERLALALGDRGVAVFDLRALEPPTPAPALDRVSRWDLPQPHEPKPSDGAVFVAIYPSSSDQGGVAQLAVVNALAELIENGDIPAYMALEQIPGHMVSLSYYTADPDRLAAFVANAIPAEANAMRVRVLKRSGPRGTPIETVR